MTDLKILYSNALEVGLTPSQFWNMSIKEAVDVINSRFKQRQDELYSGRTRGDCTARRSGRMDPRHEGEP